jgi:uncharacterized protein (TIGR03086 family)
VAQVVHCAALTKGIFYVIFAVLDDLSHLLSSLDPEQDGRPTPCSAFDVAALRRHLLGWLGYFDAALTDPSSDDRPDPTAYAGPDDPAAVVGRLAVTVRTALDSGTATTAVDVPLLGGTLPGAVVVDLLLAEVLGHGWDLARATEQPWHPDPAACEQALNRLRSLVRPEYRGPARPFGPEVAVDEGASALDRFVAFTGRDPRWAVLETPVYLRRDGLLPHALLGRTRDLPGLTRSTTVFGQECWLVSRAEDVRAVLGDPSLFTTGGSVPIFRSDDPDRFDLPGAVLFMDPPDHTVLRRMLTPPFTVGAITALRPRITELVDQHLEALAAQGPGADLVAAYSWPIPSQVMSELLGIPLEDRSEFQRYIDRGFDFSIPEAERAAANAALNEYVAGVVRRALADPGADLLGALIRDHGDALTLKTLTAVAATLIQAGHETTADMIASSVLALLTHPTQLALLRERPELVRDAIEELLRYLAIIQISPPRRATRDTTVGGQRIAKGELLLVSLPAANHDSAVTPDPGRLDITRPRQGNLAFGHGIHRCVGAPLARLELEIALPALLSRFPDLHLTVAPEQLTYKTGTVVHGVVSLPVGW